MNDWVKRCIDHEVENVTPRAGLEQHCVFILGIYCVKLESSFYVITVISFI